MFSRFLSVWSTVPLNLKPICLPGTDTEGHCVDCWWVETLQGNVYVLCSSVALEFVGLLLLRERKRKYTVMEG